MKYIKKPVVVDAITFEEFVEHGKNNAGNIVDGMPWSFQYKGHSVTHENDELYLIPTKEGTMQFTPQDMLITGIQGEIYPCKIDIFNETYTSYYEDRKQAKLNVRILVQGRTDSAAYFADNIQEELKSLQKQFPGMFLTNIQFTTSSDGRQTANITFFTH